MVTSHDVARLAGVSQPTVSRALRDASSISESTKRQVRAAAKALGYAPSAIGRELSTGKSTRVGLVVTDLHNQFHQHLIVPMHDELAKLGYELILISESSESAIADLAVATGLCGVVFATITTGSLLPVRLQERHVPFVYFNHVADCVEADAVIVDPAPGFTQLIQHVSGSGHTHLGAIFGPRNTSIGESHEFAIRDSLYERGLTLLSRDVIHGPFDFDTGHAGTHELLDQEDPPTLIFCANDVVALGALNAAAERQVAVPDQLSVVGFDDLPSSSWALVRLTTVGFDLDAMARQAIRLLVARVQGDGVSSPQRTIFPTWYVARGTLGPATRVSMSRSEM